ncbi:MAG: DUF3822 family protein [Bacteroidota bacterium]
MDKQIFDFQDIRLNQHSAANCDLYLILGVEGVSWLVTERGGQCLALRNAHFVPNGRQFADVEQDIRSVFGREDLLKWPFQSVRYALSNANVTLIPRRLFDARHLPAYFKLLLFPSDYQYRYEALPEFDCYLAYAVEETVLRTCEQYFPNAEITHLAALLLRGFNSCSPRTDYELLINIRNQAVQITVFERHNLLYFNTFQWEKPADLLYNLLLVYDQFRLNPIETPLLIAGNLLEESEIYRLLYRYFRIIKFVSSTGAMRLPIAASDLPAHYFFDLLSLNKD